MLGELKAKLEDVVEAAAAADTRHRLYADFIAFRARTTMTPVTGPPNVESAKTTLSDQGTQLSLVFYQQHYLAAGVFKDRLDRYLRIFPGKQGHVALYREMGLTRESDKAALRDVLKFKAFVDEIMAGTATETGIATGNAIGTRSVDDEGFDVTDVLALLVFCEIGRKIICRSYPTLNKTAAWVKMQNGVRTFLLRANVAHKESPNIVA
ncbi:hypothetical protein HK102_012346 [Quaeritorhiza haematococci]|nr:hypothetical protein HK102_012346 [Quaeritorhiza haematococci]